MMMNLPVFELARVLVRFDDIASSGDRMAAHRKSGGASFIFARSDSVNVHFVSESKQIGQDRFAFWMRAEMSNPKFRSAKRIESCEYESFIEQCDS